MYKNLREIAAHKKRLRSKVVVLKKHFLSGGYCVELRATVYSRVLCFFVSQKQLWPTIPRLSVTVHISIGRLQ